MEPVFTIPYSKYAVAQQIRSHFPLSDGYSLYAPMSRQEKGVDLITNQGNYVYPPRPKTVDAEPLKAVQRLNMLIDPAVVQSGLWKAVTGYFAKSKQQLHLNSTCADIETPPPTTRRNKSTCLSSASFFFQLGPPA
jgi:hypothetical protein